MKESGLKILVVAAEVSPFIKTGGLADVAGSLPQALAAADNDVRIVMPGYKGIKATSSYICDFPIQLPWRKETCIIKNTQLPTMEEGEKVPVYFINNYHYYDRDGIYCHLDDGERFAFFCRAVLDMLPIIGFKPDIIHCNDWHTGPICMLLKEKYNKVPFYKDIATVFTIHNLEYQGHFGKELLKYLELPEEFFVPEKAEFYGMFNFIKTGIVYSDIVSTVSKKYAEEIQTPQYGERLEGLLKKRSRDLYGIVNGISYNDFNPETDPRIFVNFSSDSAQLKIENKRALQREMGLPVLDVPLMGLVSRLSGQKGLNLILDVIDDLLTENVQFVLLGTGDQYYEDAFRDVKLKYPDRFGAYIGFDAALAQRIYAGSDIFLMPSRFEPCGLGQIISLRYGTIPVVRATGGLADTIIDYDSNNELGNGFSFEEFSSHEFLEAVRRALMLYNSNSAEWKKLVQKGLRADFSWSRPAAEYMKLFELAANKLK